MVSFLQKYIRAVLLTCGRGIFGLGGGLDVWQYFYIPHVSHQTFAPIFVKCLLWNLPIESLAFHLAFSVKLLFFFDQTLGVFS